MADERRREKRRLKPSRDARPPFPKPVVRHKDKRRGEKHNLHRRFSTERSGGKFHGPDES